MEAEWLFPVPISEPAPSECAVDLLLAEADLRGVDEARGSDLRDSND